MSVIGCASVQEVESEILAMADMCADAVKDGLQALKGSPQDSSVAFHVSGSLIRLILSALRYIFSLPLHFRQMPGSALLISQSCCQVSFDDLGGKREQNLLQEYHQPENQALFCTLMAW